MQETYTTPEPSAFERVERNLAELRADLDLLAQSHSRMERYLGKIEEERRDREREEHVRDELFNYDLSHSQEDE